MGRSGVLLLGFGGPDSLEAVGPFMANLTGREPSPEVVERVRRRYLAIGGRSPLNEIAGAMAAKLGSALAEAGHDVPVAVGMRYWTPLIGDALTAIVESGCDRVVTVSLSPYRSKVAQDAYDDELRRAAEAFPGVEIVSAPLLSELEAFADFYAGATAATLMDLEPNEGAILAFTAHSLPESDLEADDPYPLGLQRVAQVIAEKLGLAVGHEGAGGTMFPDFTAFGSAAAPRAWYVVYQSKGMRPGAWLGPDIDDLIDAVAASEASAVVVCPIGFATDHMETLYDLDIVAAGRALDADIEFARVPVPNDDDGLIAAIAEAVARLI